MSRSKPNQVKMSAWIGKDHATRIFPTERTYPIIEAALEKWLKKLPPVVYFKIVDIDCKLVSITMDWMGRNRLWSPLKVLVETADEEQAEDLNDRYIPESSLYLAGEGEIDPSLPTGGFTDKRWIELNQLSCIKFTALVWQNLKEIKLGSNDFGKVKKTLISV